jgi:hypothetical protein
MAISSRRIATGAHDGRKTHTNAKRFADLVISSLDHTSGSASFRVVIVKAVVQSCTLKPLRSSFRSLRLEGNVLIL